MADVDATLRAIYDPDARARCDADCNRDGRAGAADLACTVALVLEGGRAPALESP